MWFAIALLAGAFIVTALLAPKAKVENARAGTLADFTFPRSSEGDPVGLLWGTVRLRSPNTIWTGNFQSKAITKKVKTGLFSSKRQTVGYQYRIGMDLALVLGPGVAIKKIWFGKTVAWSGYLAGEGTINLDLPEFFGGEEKNGGIGGTIAFYGGALTQTQDPYLVAQIGAGVPRYNGVCHAVFRDFWLGNSTSIEAINFEAQCFTNTLGLGAKAVMPNGLDMNPVEILYDLYVNFWGRLGVDPLLLDQANFVECANIVYDEGNGMSLELAKSNSGADVTKEVIRQINAILYQDADTSKIKLKLIRRDYDPLTLPVLTPSSIKEIKNYTKKLWDETYNQVRVKYTNRDNDYANASALWQDFANINMQQRVRSTDVSMPGVYVSELANTIAAREGSELNVPLFQCEFEANRTIANLRPGDCFILQWPEYNVAASIMRIRKFDTGELANGKIMVMCVQDEFSADDVVFAEPPPTQWTPPTLTPDPITVASVFAAPYYFQKSASDIVTGANDALLWALARRPDAQSQAYNMQTSLDNFATSAMSAEEAQYSGAAQAIAAYSETVGFLTGLDNGVTGIVVGNLDGVFVPTTSTAPLIQSTGVNLMKIDNEIMSYMTVSTSGLPAGQYRLTNIQRGLFDTPIEAHAAAAPVFFLSSIDGLGETIFAGTDTPKARLQDRAPQGTYSLSLAADIGPVTIDRRSERPLQPTNLQYAGVRSGSASRNAAATVAWRERNRTDATIRFRADATQTPEAGQDNEVKWRINGGAWTTVYVAGTSTTINTSTAAAGNTLDIEVRARRDGLLSRTPEAITITLT